VVHPRKQEPRKTPWKRLTDVLTMAPADAVQENEPMGTAGPLGLARDILDDGSGDPFFVLNRCLFDWMLDQSTSLVDRPWCH